MFPLTGLEIYWLSKVRGYEIFVTTVSKALIASETQRREKVRLILTSLTLTEKRYFSIAAQSRNLCILCTLCTQVLKWETVYRSVIYVQLQTFLKTFKSIS